ncbi:MAG TPA: hypothetical protein VIK53_06990 [Verrucomicrobiae bacterium]
MKIQHRKIGMADLGVIGRNHMLNMADHGFSGVNVASQIVREPLPWKHAGKTLHSKFAMPPQGIAAITVELTEKRPGRNSKS